MNAPVPAAASGEPQTPDRAQDQTIEATAPEVTPSFGLYQPSFPLTDGDFERLQKVSPVLTAIGGSVLSFGLAYLMPIVVKQIRTESKSRVWPIDDLYIAGVLCVVGLLALLASRFFSRERRRVMNRIKEHFRQNPGHHEIREVKR